VSTDAALALARTCEQLWPPEADQPRSAEQIVRVAESLGRADLSGLANREGLAAWLRFWAMAEVTLLALQDTGDRRSSTLGRRLRRAAERVGTTAFAGAWRKRS